MSTLFLINQNTQAVRTETLITITVSHLTTHKALLALPIAIRNIKMPQHAKHQHHNSIINNNNYKQEKERYLLFYCFWLHLFSNVLRKKRQHVIFAHFQSQTTFISIKHMYLLPGWMPTPQFFFWTSPLGKKVPPPPLHHCKSKKPPVNTPLTLQGIRNSNASHLPYLSCH